MKITHFPLTLALAALLSASVAEAIPFAANRGMPVVAGFTDLSLPSSELYVDPPLKIPISQVPPRPSGPRELASFSDAELWDRVSASDRLAIVGMRRVGVGRGVWQATRLIGSNEVAQRTQELVRASGVEAVVYRDGLLPFVVIRLRDVQSLATIRRLAFVDYVEPGRFGFEPLLIGCGTSRPTWLAQRNSAGDVIPRDFAANGIDAYTWRRGPNGRGIKIGIIDTGLYKTQQQFWPNRFAAGAHPGRSIRYNNCRDQVCWNSLPAEAFDTCNHGTRIAGIIAAPLDGRSVVGAAHAADLHAIRVHDGVWTELPTLTNHLMGLRRVRHTGSRVIEMAFGGTTSSAAFSDELEFQYHRRDLPEAIFVGAAGTLVCPFWDPVAFPARHPRVVAVTGVTADGRVRNDSCNGPEVDFVTELNDSETTGEQEWDNLSLGGSSGASAIATGIIALVWSAEPQLSRADLLQRLRQTASGVSGPSPLLLKLNAYAALGGATSAWIDGPRSAAAGESYGLTARANGVGPFTYRWDSGETTAAIRRRGPGMARVTITDSLDGKSFQRNRTVSRTGASEPAEPEVDPRICREKPWTPGCGERP